METLMRFTFCGLVITLSGCLTLAERVFTCRDCVRNPSSCRRISGLYTVTVLTEGTYNPVVEIPYPACNINITEFGRSRNYIALKTKRGQGIVNSYWGIGQPGPYYGAGARFAYDRESGSCKGSCLYAQGPTSETIVVQILYNDKNPGISYEFTLPNNVAFTPILDSTFGQRATRKGSSSSSTSSSASSSSSSSSGRPSRRGRPSRPNRRYRPRPSENGGGQEEHYSGSQYSRNEGRPQVSEALEARPSEIRTSSQSGSRRKTYDYSGQRYGSHTLGGKGLSYTAAERGSDRRVRRPSERRVVSRYRPRQGRPNVVRKIAPPTYISSTRRQNPYPRQPQYQSYLGSSGRQQNTAEQRATNSQGSPSRDSFRWKISGFTECSKSCGGGVQKTNIVCVSTNDRTQVVVSNEDCASSRKPREQIVECNTSPCEPAWEFDEWSECSVTCGSGTQTRVVECRQRFSPSLTLRVSADQCGLQAKPALAQQCEKGFCSRWKIGQWGQCSRECGGGERSRPVHCVDQFQSQIPANYCTDAKPLHKESCNTQNCLSVWWMSEWNTECSSTCGQGSYSRSAVCLNERGQVLSAGHCGQQPSVSKACTSDATCSGSWFAGPWGRCSSTCGEGLRSRSVVCVKRDSEDMTVVSDNQCDEAAKPEIEEECQSGQCRAVWFINNWSECSVSCGEGYRTREVRCVENQRTSTRCLAAVKPATRQVCRASPCLSYQKINRYVPRRRERQEVQLAAEGPAQRCEDSVSHCLYVLQSRLCSYRYYQDKCCKTCSKHR